jgi:hypothetical protein
MANDKLIHDWMVSYLKQRLSRDFKDISMNLEGEKKNEFQGHYPDLILGNHGMVLSVMEVETEKSINPEKADEWKALTGLGVKLILMVPTASKAKVVDLLWKSGIMDKTSVGSYEINVRMP